MKTIHVRPATLDDTRHISALFCAHITAWQRINPQGRVEDVPYDSLTIYERWLHGGPWMGIETAALHLSHLLRGAGLPVVAEIDGAVLAYAEAYHGLEPAPFGDHLHLGGITIANGHENAGLDDALLKYLLEQAAAFKCDRLTVNCAGAHDPAAALYQQHGMAAIAHVRRFAIPARTGQVFYKAVEHFNANPAQISEWFMPVGHTGSARQQWETLWPRTWHAIAEIRAQRAFRLHFSAAGQDAYVFCQQQLYAPRSVDVYCWSPKPLSGQLLTAIRDWAHREGYRTLLMSVMDDTVKTLGAEAEPDGYTQEIYAVNV